MTLTPLELAIMKSVWRRGSARVKEVREDLYPERRLAYTTVLTVMDRLFRKGALRRRKTGRAHMYEPVDSESAVRSQAVQVLVESFFGGSEAELRRYLQSPEQAIQTRPAAPVDAEAPTPDHPIEDSLL